MEFLMRVKNRWLPVMGMLLLAGAALAQPPAENRRAERWRTYPTERPAQGQLAPDFSLKDLDGKELHLSELFGKPIVIEFGSYT
jgi:cytochrome oxidase Cu insertion factor (SCO1/SenC/PrrC family)